MKKDKKDIAFTNRVKLILAGIGVVFFMLIVFIALYEQAPITQNNATEQNRELHESTTVIVSSNHPTNEQEFEAMKQNPPEGTNFAIIEDLPGGNN
jgi:uncharacterized membrane protein YgaE (UPF0421/DUF939 family)